MIYGANAKTSCLTVEFTEKSKERGDKEGWKICLKTEDEERHYQQN